MNDPSCNLGTESRILDTMEPNPLATLQSHCAIRMLWVSTEIPTMVKFPTATARPSFPFSEISRPEQAYLSPVLKQRIMDALATHMLVPIAALPDTIFIQREYYNLDACLQFTLEEEVGRSQWEPVFPHKRINAVITAVNGGAPNANQAIGTLLAKFKNQYTNCVRRCLIINPTAVQIHQFEASPEVVMINCVQHGGVERAIDGVMTGIAVDVVTRLNVLLAELEKGMHQKSLLAPVEYRLPSDQSILAARAAKHRADILLQLGATEAARSMLTQVSSTLALWTGACLETFAALRFSESQRLISKQRQFLRNVSSYPLFHPIVQLDVKQLMELVKDIEANYTASTKSASKFITDKVKTVLGTSIETNLFSAAKDLREGLAKAIRAQQSEDTDELEDQAATRLDLMFHYERLGMFLYQELQAYLRDAWTRYEQAQKADAGPKEKTSFSIIVTEAHLKLMDLHATFHNGEELLLLIQHLGAEHIPTFSRDRIMRQVPYLCERAGYSRKAAVMLKEAALKSADAKDVAMAVRLMFDALNLAGILIKVHSSGAITFPTEERFVVRYLTKESEICSTEMMTDADALKVFDSLETTRKLVEFDGMEWSLKKESAAKDSKETDDLKKLPLAPSIQYQRVENLKWRASAKKVPLKVQVQLLWDLYKLLNTMMDPKYGDPQVANACTNAEMKILFVYVIGILLFEYGPYLDADQVDRRRKQSDLIIHFRTHSAPFYVPPTSASPPLLKSARILPLSDALAPLTKLAAGARLDYNPNGNIVVYRGKQYFMDDRSKPAIWAVGALGSIELTLTNPFESSLTIVRVELNYDIVPPGESTGSLVGANIIDAPAANRAATDVSLAARSTQRILLNVDPHAEGTLCLKGILVFLSVQHKEERRPIIVDLPSFVTAPVMGPLPRLHCQPVETIHLLAGQQHGVELSITNIGSVDVEALALSFHKSECRLDSCQGCLHRRLVTEADAATTVVRPTVDFAVSELGKFLGRGYSRTLAASVEPATFLSQPVVQEVKAQVKYEARMEETGPISAVNNSPTFVPIPARIERTIFTILVKPSLKVVSVTLTSDERRIEVKLLNQTQTNAFHVGSSKKIDGTILNQPFVLRPQEEHSLVLFTKDFPWAKVDKPEKIEDWIVTIPWTAHEYHHNHIHHNEAHPEPMEDHSNSKDRTLVPTGSVSCSVAKLMNGFTFFEPLEEVTVAVFFSSNVESPLSPQSTQLLSSSSMSSPPRQGSMASTKHFARAPSWVSRTASSSSLRLTAENLEKPNVRIPAIQSMNVTIELAAPTWETENEVVVDVSLGKYDGGLLGGITKTTVKLGGQGESVDGKPQVIMELELILFSVGDHHLRVRLEGRNGNGQVTQHIVPLVAQHEFFTTTMSVESDPLMQQ